MLSCLIDLVKKLVDLVVHMPQIYTASLDFNKVPLNFFQSIPVGSTTLFIGNIWDFHSCWNFTHFISQKSNYRSFRALIRLIPVCLINQHFYSISLYNLSMMTRFTFSFLILYKWIWFQGIIHYSILRKVASLITLFQWIRNLSFVNSFMNGFKTNYM